MELQVAIQLIEEGIEQNNTPQVWADLGAGTGLFTNALSTKLHNGSIIYAVDKNLSSLNAIAASSNVAIKKIQADFVKDDWMAEPLTGLLIANALHFVKDQTSFLMQMKQMLVPDGRILLVEYETENTNQWVPYPVAFSHLRNMVSSRSFTTIKKLKEVPSVYDNRMIYSALLK